MGTSYSHIEGTTGHDRAARIAANKHLDVEGGREVCAQCGTKLEVNAFVQAHVWSYSCCCLMQPGLVPACKSCNHHSKPKTQWQPVAGAAEMYPLHGTFCGCYACCGPPDYATKYPTSGSSRSSEREEVYQPM